MLELKLEVYLILKVTILIDRFLQSPRLIPQCFRFPASSSHLYISIDESNFMQAFLFDRFTRTRRVGTHGESSNGLVMSIVKTIIEWHGEGDLV